MRYISVCSGIEAATVAWEPLGWEPVAFAEIEPFPCAVLKHHWPNVPNLGDMTKIDGRKYRGFVDLLVGGTPCQGFSVAGKRGGLQDARSCLALEYVRLAEEILPRWIVWENVPGCLSTANGDDFKQFLAALDDVGYSLAWSVLDAQWFGVAQRRRRVFVVGHLGNWKYPAEVLFEREGMPRDTPPCRETRQEAPAVAGKLLSTSFTPSQHGQYREGVGTLRASGGDLGGGSETLIIGFDAYNNIQTGNQSKTLDCGSDYHNVPIVFQQNYAVRRLTPMECERLQGFPDGHTAIPWKGKPAEECPDGPRYKALGNSMAVPCMRWIGERIDAVDNSTGDKT